MSVESILKANKLTFKNIRLGEVELEKTLGKKQLQTLSDDLEKVGFELLDDQKTQLIEQVKNLLIQKVQEGNIEEHFSLQKFLTQKVFKDYSSISKLFSEVEGITLEQFFILQKIEKIKEWLTYNEESLSQLSLRLGYSSSQHLSGQFKKLTGMTPTKFKALGNLHRTPIDSLNLP